MGLGVGGWGWGCGLGRGRGEGGMGAGNGVERWGWRGRWEGREGRGRVRSTPKGNADCVSQRYGGIRACGTGMGFSRRRSVMVGLPVWITRLGWVGMAAADRS